MSPRFDTLLTGAAGRLGTHLRRGLAPLARTLRVSDRAEIAGLQPNEEAVICDLADAAAVLEMTRGVEAIVHFGGAPMEMDWNTVLQSSIVGSYNVYEGAPATRSSKSGSGRRWRHARRPFEAIRVVNQWAGHNDFNTLDHTLIVGRDPVVTNFVHPSGFPGHGLQQGPATGRARVGAHRP